MLSGRVFCSELRAAALARDLAVDGLDLSQNRIHALCLGSRHALVGGKLVVDLVGFLRLRIAQFTQLLKLHCVISMQG
jgi:hypothetical protein